MYSIVLVSRDHGEILVHALARVRQARDQPYYGNPTLHIIFGFLPLLALVHPIYVVPGKASPHPTSWVPFEEGLVSNNPGIATSIKAKRESLALIMFFGLWKRFVDGLYPRMTWVALSCPSLCKNISDLKILFRSLKFTKCLAGAVWYSSAKWSQVEH